MESINKLIVHTQNDLARCDELIYGCSRWDVVPYPKRLNMIECAYKAMIKLTFISLTCFALISAKAKLMP